MEVEEIIRRQREAREARKIRCPHCGHEFDFTDENYGVVTYWGEEPPVELECDGCESTFFAREHVERTFTVGKTADEAERV